MERRDANHLYFKERQGNKNLRGLFTGFLPDTLTPIGTYGDILISYNIYSSGPASYIPGHAAIVHTDQNYTIESYHIAYSPIKEDGVRRYINDWGNKPRVYGLRVKGASHLNYYRAAQYAHQQAVAKKPYNTIFTDKYRTDAFYCSQLVWRAWLEQGFNLDGIQVPIRADMVTPYDLTVSEETYIFYEHDGIGR